MSHSLKRRIRQLMRCVPEALNYETLLYIGASRKRMQMIELFDGAGYEITILEIWKENVEYLREHTPSPPWNKRPVTVIQEDVRNVGLLKFGYQLFDVVMWWHGPEHIQFRERSGVLNELVNLTRRITIIGSPPGEYPQEKAQENPHEKHHEKMTEDFFHDPDLVNPGWKTDVDSNNLLAWRKT